MTSAVWAPGRVNVIGEHVDYHGGTCVPMAISRGLTIRLTPSPDQFLSVRSSLGYGSWDDATAVTGWASYVAAALAQCAITQVHVEVVGDLPSGAGLSSSAAVTCGVIAAASHFANLNLTPSEIAERARRAETLGVGAATGGLDQWALATAGPDWVTPLTFRSDPPALGSPVRWPADWWLVVLDTGVSHEHASGDYAVRRAEAAQEAARLSVPPEALALLDPHAAPVARLLSSDHVTGRRLRHVLSEEVRTRAFLTALTDSDALAAGRELTASHVSLRVDYEVSCRELDEAVAALLRAGCTGARMTGGGFGGCAIGLVVGRRSDADVVAARSLADLRLRGLQPGEAWVERPAGSWKLLEEGADGAGGEIGEG